MTVSSTSPTDLNQKFWPNTISDLQVEEQANGKRKAATTNLDTDDWNEKICAMDDSTGNLDARKARALNNRQSPHKVKAAPSYNYQNANNDSPTTNVVRNDTQTSPKNKPVGGKKAAAGTKMWNAKSASSYGRTSFAKVSQQPWSFGIRPSSLSGFASVGGTMDFGSSATTVGFGSGVPKAWDCPATSTSGFASVGGTTAFGLSAPNVFGGTFSGALDSTPAVSSSSMGSASFNDKEETRSLSASSAFIGAKTSNIASAATDQLAFLSTVAVPVSDIAIKPFTGTQLVDRLQTRFQDILSKYIPCVEFLVECQQELHGGLAGRGLSASQYYDCHIHALPQKFVAKQQLRHQPMDATAQSVATRDLEHLRENARAVQHHGPEAVKSHFLGGMKDGESWGLRKWLSKHGAGLEACTDLECILLACRRHLEKDVQHRLATTIRPMAQMVLERLQKDIPLGYQTQSSAHPHLPYFHRLEAALRNMARYCQEDDDIVCLDDSEDDDDVKQVQLTEKQKKRKKAVPAARRVEPPPCYVLPASATTNVYHSDRVSEETMTKAEMKEELYCRRQTIAGSSDKRKKWFVKQLGGGSLREKLYCGPMHDVPRVDQKCTVKLLTQELRLRKPGFKSTKRGKDWLLQQLVVGTVLLTSELFQQRIREGIIKKDENAPPRNTRTLVQPVTATHGSSFTGASRPVVPDGPVLSEPEGHRMPNKRKRSTDTMGQAARRVKPKRDLQGVSRAAYGAHTVYESPILGIRRDISGREYCKASYFKD